MNRVALTALAASFLMAGLPAISAGEKTACELSFPLEVRVLTLTTFLEPAPGEAGPWLEREELRCPVPVDGLAAPAVEEPLVCDRAGHHCLLITGMGKANAAASVLAAGLSPKLDLRRAYVLLAGIAGGLPEEVSLGSGAWARFVVDGDLAHEIDARQLPDGWRHPYFRLGCASPWCDGGFTTGTERHALDAELAEAAYRISLEVELADSEGARAARQRYGQSLARRPPTLSLCDTLAADTFWHGESLADWAAWWVERWSGEKARLCMSAMEETGVLTALDRLQAAGRADRSRVLMLRVASNFVEPPPGAPPLQALSELPAFELAIENAYRLGSAVARRILADWSGWREDPPSIPEPSGP